jgi:hypothetical protein
LLNRAFQGISWGAKLPEGVQGGYLEHLGFILAIMDIIVGTIAKPLTKTVRY